MKDKNWVSSLIWISALDWSILPVLCDLDWNILCEHVPLWNVPLNVSISGVSRFDWNWFSSSLWVNSNDFTKVFPFISKDWVLLCES